MGLRNYLNIQLFERIYQLRKCFLVDRPKLIFFKACNKAGVNIGQLSETALRNISKAASCTERSASKIIAIAAMNADAAREVWIAARDEHGAAA